MKLRWSILKPVFALSLAWIPIVFSQAIHLYEIEIPQIKSSLQIKQDQKELFEKEIFAYLPLEEDMQEKSIYSKKIDADTYQFFMHKLSYIASANDISLTDFLNKESSLLVDETFDEKTLYLHIARTNLFFLPPNSIFVQPSDDVFNEFNEAYKLARNDTSSPSNSRGKKTTPTKSDILKEYKNRYFYFFTALEPIIKTFQPMDCNLVYTHFFNQQRKLNHNHIVEQSVWTGGNFQQMGIIGFIFAYCEKPNRVFGAP